MIHVPSQCSIGGCLNPSYCRGYCRCCYDQGRRDGSIARVKTDDGELLDQIEIIATVNGKGCVLWDGPVSRYGYARVWFKGRMQQAHAVSLIHAAGPRPPNMLACHVCRSRNCIAPWHLIWQTAKQNAFDKNRDGTNRRGGDIPTARLTEIQVLDIRRIYSGGDVTQKTLAESFGVKQTTIGDVVNRKSWKHV